jgi:hypothetical protein
MASQCTEKVEPRVRFIHKACCWRSCGLFRVRVARKGKAQGGMVKV